MSVERDVVSTIADVWDREPDGIWSPAGLSQFKIGDRVRVLQRPECHYCRDSEDEDGVTGIVEEVEFSIRRGGCDCRECRAHPVWVRFDEPAPVGGGPFAHCELIPLDGAS